KDKLTVSVGRDCRLTSDELAESLINGITKGGIDVVRIGVCPTPLTYFSIFHLNLDGGIMVTGSHNPADYNGFKVCIGGDTIHGSEIQENRKIMESLGPRFSYGTGEPDGMYQVGSVKDVEIIPPYLDYVSRNARPAKKPKKVVLDAGNGTASTVAPPLFE